MSLDWFKVHAAELLADERFQECSLAERGAWWTLLAHAWVEGSIPADPAKIARICREDASAMRPHWERICDRFAAHPTLAGRLVSPRQERERKEAIAQVEKKSAAAAAAAKARWNKKNSRDASALRTQSGSSANAMRIDASKEKDQDQEKDQKEEACAETGSAPPSPRQDDSPIVAVLPCVGAGPKEFHVTAGMCAAWAKAYPGVNVMAEVGKAVQWAVDNPKKRKTAAGARSFLGRWMARQQNEGPRNGAQKIQAGLRAPAPSEAFGNGGFRKVQ